MKTAKVEAIHDVLIVPLRQICDERGKVMHMLRCDDPHFQKFGEIYFSTIFPGIVKAWHIHSEMTLNYACVSGMIKLVLYDDRASSPSRGNIQEIVLGDSNYCLVTIPPGIWNGFKCLGPSTAIVANCSTVPHSKDEISRADPLNSEIPYDWGSRWC
jgi:dTDP-4-dehydrorhamnose 3,5-epimerase